MNFDLQNEITRHPIFHLNADLLKEKRAYKQAATFVWDGYFKGELFWTDTFSQEENDNLWQQFIHQDNADLERFLQKLLPIIVRSVSRQQQHSNRDRYLLMKEILHAFFDWFTAKFPENYTKEFVGHKRNKLGNLMYFEFIIKNKTTGGVKRLRCELHDFGDLTAKITAIIMFCLQHLKFTLPLSDTVLTGYDENTKDIVLTLLKPDWFAVDATKRKKA